MAAALNIETLAKVWALAERGAGGEAQAARARAAAMIEPHGYALEDVPDLIAGLAGPEPGAGGFTFYNMSNPAHVRAYAAQERAKCRRWMAEHAVEIAEVIVRYGSEEAVFAPTPDERAFDDAIEPFREKRGGDNADTFDGELFGPTSRVRTALGNAKPWPTTIPDALAELEAWERLQDDRNTADGNRQREYLSQGADFRRWALGDMVNKDLPARNLSDVITRLRFQVDSQGTYDATEAVLADLERLQAAHAGKSGNGTKTAQEADSCRIDFKGRAAPDGPAGGDGRPFNLNTASQRRAAVERILNTPEGQRLSLRAIAAMAGVSPATVMAARKRRAA
ncbi:hypothetical protein [Gluconacetobacter diazotrophicus]|nr:hypothetical protein [Gluconacetobacter diazotrophicus]